MAARTKAPARPKGMVVRNFRLAEVDPRTLVLDPCNVRDEDVQPTQDMLDSVAQDGVDTPVIVRPLTAEQVAALQVEGQPAPQFGVLAGQQRWLSSKQAAERAEEDHTAWFALPIVIREDLKGADMAAVTRSLVENTHRKAMTHRNTVRAVAQLAAFAMEPAERKRVARSIGLTPEQFEAAKAASELDPATLGKTAAMGFDMVQQIQYDEMKDVPGASSLLKEAAAKDAAGGGGYGHWDHAVATLAQRREGDRLRKERVEALRAAKVLRVDRPGEWRGDRMRALSDLVSGMGNPIDAEHHAKDCPGRAFYIDYDGEPVHVCADWKKSGHRLSPQAAAKKGAPEDAEASKAAARLVRANNEAFRAATTVRRAALQAALKEKVNDGSWALVRGVVCRMPRWYAQFVTNPDLRLMARLLGAPESVTDRDSSSRDPREWLEKAAARMGAASSGKVVLAQVLAAYEARVMNADKIWDKPGREQVELLVFMRDHLGYTLSEIEAAMVAHVEGIAPAPKPTPDSGEQEPALPGTPGGEDPAGGAGEPEEDGQDGGAGSDAAQESGAGGAGDLADAAQEDPAGGTEDKKEKEEGAPSA